MHYMHEAYARAKSTDRHAYLLHVAECFCFSIFCIGVPAHDTGESHRSEM